MGLGTAQVAARLRERTLTVPVAGTANKLGLSPTEERPAVRTGSVAGCAGATLATQHAGSPGGASHMAG